ncbi:MAG: ATPase, T2SS/T4P/T4SS family [Lawsonella sp.]
MPGSPGGGEVRGIEIVDLLNALNTGHQGALASLHANSPSEVPSRIMGLALPTGLPEAAIRQQMKSGIKVVVHVHRDNVTGMRKVAAIEEFSC